MKRKKLIFLASDPYVKERNTRDLIDFFDGFLDVESIALQESAAPEKMEGDLLLTLTPIDSSVIRQYVNPEVEILHGTRTIRRERYERLADLPGNAEIAVVSINKRGAFNLAYFLLQIGISHVDFIPAYPGIKQFPEADYVIIPERLDFGDIDVDAFGDRLIDLGGRTITAETFRAIMLILNIRNEILEAKLENCQKVNLEVKELPLSKIYRSERILSSVLNEIDNGVIITNQNNKVIYINDQVVEICGLEKELGEVSYLNKIHLPDEIYNALVLNELIEDKLINIKASGKNILLSRKRIVFQNNEYGHIITLKDVTKLESLETQLRGMLVKKGYTARYTFKDITGKSQAIQECIHTAKKMARTDRPVLIMGESGTGKEMFAQAIHNHSHRRNDPFIAINCASLSAELLSSELFGYEEGSFTGAKKGGKKGLFELAHKGTLFLDEIAEISPDIQVKLLRVLQENEIRRIGGDRIIPIDVRIIAATNRDLNEMMENGEFRIDLYYRLNVFTLFIPPLRDRKEDIDLIVHNLMCDIGYGHKQIDQETMTYLYNQEMRGNIRELKNIIEYMAYMGDDLLTLADLPGYMRDPYRGPRPAAASRHGDNQADEEDIALFILKTLRYSNVGRRRMYELCIQNGMNITVYKVRQILDALCVRGLIGYGRGRRGAVITELGKSRLSEWTDSGNAVL